MNTNVVITVLVILIVAILGYLYITRWSADLAAVPPEINALTDDVEETADTITESAAQGVLPSVETPDVLPTAKTNPFSDIKTNPFE